MSNTKKPSPYFCVQGFQNRADTLEALLEQLPDATNACLVNELGRLDTFYIILPKEYSNREYPIWRNFRISSFLKGYAKLLKFLEDARVDFKETQTQKFCTGIYLCLRKYEPCIVGNEDLLPKEDIDILIGYNAHNCKVAFSNGKLASEYNFNFMEILALIFLEMNGVRKSLAGLSNLKRRADLHVREMDKCVSVFEETFR